MAPADPAGGDLAGPFPERPRRHSLRDDELVTELADATGVGATLEAIDRMQAELELRAADAREYREWESRMRRIGSPEAITAVERVREEFADVAPPAPVAGPPRRVEQERLTAPRMVMFAPSVTSRSGPPPPTYDEAHEILFDDPLAVAEADDTPDAEAFAVVRGPESGLRPVPDGQRRGRAARLFWLWFAGNASLLSIVVGAALFSLGMSLRQSLVAALTGVAISLVPVAIATLAGRLSGQPLVVVSQVVFGRRGNALPAGIALVSRVFWAAVLTWILSAAIARILVVSRLAVGEAQLTVAVLAGAVLISAAAAFVGFSAIARLQSVVTALSGVLVAGFVAATVGRVDLRVALTIGDGPWILVVSGAVVVFSAFGLLWANGAADLTRYQRAASSGVASVAWAGAGAAIPALVLVGYGALLAASDPSTAGGFLADPVDAIAALLPTWYPVPLIAAVSLGLLSAVTVGIYSGGFALQSLVPRLDHRVCVGAVSIAVTVVAVVLAVVVDDFGVVLRDVVTILAVPLAAWTGMVGVGLVTRRTRPQPAPPRRDIDVVNVVLLIVITAIGFGLTTGSGVGLDWQGYLFVAVGVPLDGDVAASDLGVLVALALGLAAPLFTRDERRMTAARREVSTSPGTDGPDPAR